MAPAINVIMWSSTVSFDVVPIHARARRQSALAVIVADAILASVLEENANVKDAIVKKIVHALIMASASVAKKMSRHSVAT